MVSSTFNSGFSNSSPAMDAFSFNYLQPPLSIANSFPQYNIDPNICHCCSNTPSHSSFCGGFVNSYIKDQLARDVENINMKNQRNLDIINQANITIQSNMPVFGVDIPAGFATNSSNNLSSESSSGGSNDAVSSVSEDKTKSVTNDIAWSNLTVVLLCYIASLSLFIHFFTPTLTHFALCFSTSIFVIAFTHHTLVTSKQLDSIHKLIKQWRCDVSSKPITATAVLFYRSALIFMSLPCLLVHVGFESAVAMHGAFVSSKSLAYAFLVASAHGISELFAEYNSLFPDVTLIPKFLSKRVSSIQLPATVFSYKKLLLGLCFVCHAGFSFAALMQLQSVLMLVSPIYVFAFNVLCMTLSSAYACAHMLTISRTFFEQKNTTLDIKRAHVLFGVFSTLSGMALFYEYKSHLLLVANYINISLLPGLVIPISIILAAVTACLWSMTMLSACVTGAGCVSCVDTKESDYGLGYIKDMVMHTAGLVGGVIASIELGDFVCSVSSVSNVALLPASIVAAVSGYLVEYSFLSGDSTSVNKYESSNKVKSSTLFSPLSSIRESVSNLFSRDNQASAVNTAKPC